MVDVEILNYKMEEWIFMKELDFDKDMSVEELLEKLNELEGVEAKLELVKLEDINEEPKIITSKDIRLELERIMILIEEQKEYEVAVDKIKELYSLFEDMEWGEYTFEIEWDT